MKIPKIPKHFKRLEKGAKLLLVTVSGIALIVAAMHTFAPSMGVKRGVAHLRELVPYTGQDLIDFRGQYVTAEFLLSKDEGRGIRYWYENRGDTDVIIRLNRIGWLGHQETVSRQTVPVGAADGGVYATTVIDRAAVYQVTLNPATTSSYLNGTLRVTQARDTEP